MSARIAVVDDEARMGRVLAMVLGRDGHTVEAFTDGEAMLGVFDERAFDLVITDLKMPGIDGMEVLRRVKAAREEVPVIVLTAHGTVSRAVEALRAGAWDFLEKPFDNDACRAAARRALEHTALARQNRYLRAELRQRYRLDELVVRSDSMRQLFELAHRAARSRATVLIWGESGTGKELVARSIHYHSERVGQPFVPINCEAFAEGVLESELFGHTRGAFTGASGARDGVFVRAGGGTIFLDEIGGVSPGFQARLLRVLQEGEVQPVGADEARPVDVRVVAAARQDLREEVAQGRFREDLYFRLAVIPIELPPLRERPEEIVPLARHFLARMNHQLGRELIGWTEEVEAWMLGHDWPGNVRELENTLERAAVLARSERIELEDLMLEATSGAPGPEGPGAQTLEAVLDEATRRHVRATLARTGGHRQEAADRLGIDRTTLYRMMKRLGIED